MDFGIKLGISSPNYLIFLGFISEIKQYIVHKAFNSVLSY